MDNSDITKHLNPTSSTSDEPNQERRSSINSATPGVSQARRSSIDSANPGTSQAQGTSSDSAIPAPGNIVDDPMGDAGPRTSRTRKVYTKTPEELAIYAMSGYKRLSGAGRKRLWRLLGRGLSPEEAMSQARIPSSDQPGGGAHRRNLKRSRPEDTSPKDKPSKAPRTTASPGGRGHPPPSYRDIAGATRVGIRNAVPMTEAQMRLVHDALVETIFLRGESLNNRGDGPKFLGFTHKTGWILVTCENQSSKDWLAEEISRCKPWPEASLSIMEDSELPRPVTATVLIPLSEAPTVARALSIIRYQNEGLFPEHWRVLNEKVEEGGIVAVLSLDEASVETLRACDFRVTIGFRKMLFRIKGEHKNQTSGATTAQTSNITAVPGPSGLGGSTSGHSDSTVAIPGPSGLGGRVAGHSGTAVPVLSGREGGAAGSNTSNTTSTPGPSGLVGSSTAPSSAVARRKKKADRRSAGHPPGKGQTLTITGGDQNQPPPVIKRGK